MNGDDNTRKPLPLKIDSTAVFPTSDNVSQTNKKDSSMFSRDYSNLFMDLFIPVSNNNNNNNNNSNGNGRFSVNDDGYDKDLCDDFSRMRINGMHGVSEGHMEIGPLGYNGFGGSVGSGFLEQWRLSRGYYGNGFAVPGNGMDFSDKGGADRDRFMHSRLAMDVTGQCWDSYYMRDDRASLTRDNGGLRSLGENRVNHGIDRGGVSSSGYRQDYSKENRRRNMMERWYGVCHGNEPSECNGNRQSLIDWSALLSCYSLVELKGYIDLIAKDRNGCQLLLKMLDEGTEVDLIFNEILNHIVEVILNPFGNYLVQKLLGMCDEEQIMKILRKVTEVPGQLVDISLHSHGKRVVQKLIQTLRGRPLISLVISALEPGFLDLAMDLNGNHVLQSCLECLSIEDNEFIFRAATTFCVRIATHQYGCCILQEYIQKAAGEQLEKLVNHISANGLHLAQDPYGNYVVQVIIKLKTPMAAAILHSQFEGNYVPLSVQKFSSHVVEKCLAYFEDVQPAIVWELLFVPRFDKLMQDPYANYVIKAALKFTKGRLHASLVHAAQPHKSLRTNPYCKNIFSSINPRNDMS